MDEAERKVPARKSSLMKAAKLASSLRDRMFSGRTSKSQARGAAAGDENNDPTVINNDQCAKPRAIKVRRHPDPPRSPELKPANDGVSQRRASKSSHAKVPESRLQQRLRRKADAAPAPLSIEDGVDKPPVSPAPEATSDAVEASLVTALLPGFKPGSPPLPPRHRSPVGVPPTPQPSGASSPAAWVTPLLSQGPGQWRRHSGRAVDAAAALKQAEAVEATLELVGEKYTYEKLLQAHASAMKTVDLNRYFQSDESGDEGCGDGDGGWVEKGEPEGGVSEDGTAVTLWAEGGVSSPDVAVRSPASSLGPRLMDRLWSPLSTSLALLSPILSPLLSPVLSPLRSPMLAGRVGANFAANTPPAAAALASASISAWTVARVDASDEEPINSGTRSASLDCGRGVNPSLTASITPDITPGLTPGLVRPGAATPSSGGSTSRPDGSSSGSRLKRRLTASSLPLSPPAERPADHAQTPTKSCPPAPPPSSSSADLTRGGEFQPSAELSAGASESSPGVPPAASAASAVAVPMNALFSTFLARLLLVPGLFFGYAGGVSDEIGGRGGVGGGGGNRVGSKAGVWGIGHAAVAIPGAAILSAAAFASFHHRRLSGAWL